VLGPQKWGGTRDVETAKLAHSEPEVTQMLAQAHDQTERLGLELAARVVTEWRAVTRR
jgi:hypothetical protein